MSDLDLTSLPADALFAIARNESAEYRYRRAACRLMLQKGYPRVNHPELVLIVQDVKNDLGAEAEVADIVTAAIEAPFAEPVDEEPGPFKAGFTTENL